MSPSVVKEGGLNYWWGTERAYAGGGQYRSQWSLAWWDNPDVIKLKSTSYTGAGFKDGCGALTMATIDPRYTPEQWESFIKDNTVPGTDDGRRVMYAKMFREHGLEHLTVNNVNMTGDEIQGIVNQGYNSLSLSVDNYYDITGEGPFNHKMTVNQIKYVPNKYVDLHVSDWGWGSINTNGVYNYNTVYRLGNTKFNPLYFTFFK